MTSLLLTKIVAAACLNLSQPKEVKEDCINWWTNCAYSNKVEECKRREPVWNKIKLNQ